MGYNFKSNAIFDMLTSKSQPTSISANDFITRANDTSMVIEEGIIESTFISGEGVFAVIRKNTSSRFSPTGDQIDHGDGWFNGPDRNSVETTTVAELAILTNIDVSNNQLKRYKGSACHVVVKNGIAIYADVRPPYPSLTTIPASFIRKVRVAIEGKSDDIFSDIGRKYFRDAGYSEEDINSLSDFKYVSSMYGKVNTFAGEALWFKDTSQQQEEENIIKPNGIILGLNKLGMKSKNCHKPSRIFSGK